MTLKYSQMHLDRCTNQRKNARWLKSQFNSDTALFCPVDDGNNLFSAEAEPIYLKREQLNDLSINSCVFLGKDSRHGYFSFDSNKLSFAAQENLSTLGQWLPLRNMGATINHTDCAILALAKGLIHWHRTHLHCGKCGAINKLIEAGHARQCTHSQCRNMTFPRTDPAVIMLVEHLDEQGVARCLLGRQGAWQPGMYSTLAGFVDPGETLEEAVAREVLEESGVIVNTDDVSYVASQPWPFPASIMLGFCASAISQTIDISHDDLEDAQWFTRQQLAEFVAKEDPTEHQEGMFRMSSIDSISHYLISAWHAGDIGKY
jgi:NAD+ diphosphatase